MSFVTVTEEQAKDSRFYGFDGWLIVFYVYAVYSVISAAAVALAFLQFEGPFFPFEPFDVRGFHAMLAVRVISLLPFLILTPMKHRLMPLAAIICEWINTAVMMYLLPSTYRSMFEAMIQFMTDPAMQSAIPPGSAPTMVQFHEMAEVFVQFALWNGILFGIAMTALFTWYLLASKRVNATYRHRLKPETTQP